MREIAAPLHVGKINGQPVRFFRAPSGRPELPWHALEDLYRALGLPRSVRRDLLRKTQAHWSAEMRTIATADGLVTIAPHFIAQGLIGAATEADPALEHLENQYAEAGSEAMRRLTGDLPPEALIRHLVAAYNNSQGVGGEPA